MESTANPRLREQVRAVIRLHHYTLYIGLKIVGWC